MKIQDDAQVARLKKMLERIDQPARAAAKDTSRDVLAAGSPVAVSQDQLTLSAKGQELQKLRDEIESSPDVRADIVEKLRSEISSGRYRIDGTRIADALTNED
jgi:flagellar biosynthesis anti-sigma factor FlgM